MIITSTVFIKEIKDGKIVGVDLTDGKEYNCEFFTDIDITKCKNKERPKNFKSEKVSQEMLLGMIENANNFNERDTKVADKLKESIENSETLNAIKKMIEKLEDEKSFVFDEDEDIRIVNKDIQERFNVKKVNKENYDEIYKGLKDFFETEKDLIKSEINENYDFVINSAITFTGNLVDNVITSKNAYVDQNGKLTDRNSFYSPGVRGNYFKQDLTMALKVIRREKDNNVWWDYIIESQYLNKNKIFNLIKRNINTIEKTGKGLLIYFLKNDSETKLEEIEKFNELSKEYNDKVADSKEKDKVFAEYSNRFLEMFKDIQSKLDNEEFLSTLISSYGIKIPIKNNFEFEKAIKEVVNKELVVLKNINKRLFTEVCELRAEETKQSVEIVSANMAEWAKKLMLEETMKIKTFFTFFRIAGVKDTNNDGYGFITEVPNSSRAIKNLIGVTPNLESFAKMKEDIINKLKGFKEKLEKK